MPDISQWDILLRLLLAAGLGGAIGLERELRDREAGFRTHLLVSVGAAVFTLVSAYGFADFRYGLQSGITLDPSRIAAQIVTGVGFLGAGAIIRQGLSIRGLTTAATLWIVAAIGMAAAAGFYSAAIYSTAIVLISLWPLRLAAHRLLVRIRPEEGRLLVRMPPGQSAVPLLTALEEVGARVDSLEIEDSDVERAVVVVVHHPDRAALPRLVERLTASDDVRKVEWTA